MLIANPPKLNNRADTMIRAMVYSGPAAKAIAAR